VTSPNQRSALAALNVARPIIARLDPARNQEDLAADLLESWSGVETALRSLVGGSALSGQPLITDLRARQLLTLDQAHALLAFLAARDRAQNPSYRPTGQDTAAAREGFQKLEGGLVSGAAATVASPGVAAPAETPVAVDVTPRDRRYSLRLLISLATVIVLAAILVGWYLFRPKPYDKGVAFYRQGAVVAARDQFARAVANDPKNARAHLFLGRIAREQRDYPAAQQHLAEAVRLAPQSAEAQREMGGLMLAIGNDELARRFYVRAVSLDPNDRAAQGFLGCSLIRLGRFEEGMRFITRAGTGPWGACVPVAAPPR
jgi:tetratricopeptide (TPR) repeat protein